MARDRPTPHIAWPLKALAVAAIAGAVLAAVNEVRGDDPRESVLRRHGSVEVSGTLSQAAKPLPAAYAITSRVAAGDAISTEVHRVVAPFDARTETFAGTDVKGDLLAEREVAFGYLGTRSKGATLTTLEAPPAIAGPRLGEALRSSEELGLVERREVRKVAGRRCQVWRTSAEFGATTLVPPRAGEYLDLCVDAEGLLLEEWQVDAGQPVRQKVAVRVELDGVGPSEVAMLPREITLPLDQGGGSVKKIGDTERPVGPFLDVATPPDGFRLQGRYTVVPPNPGLREGGDRGKVRAATVDVYVRGVDAIVVERGGVLDLSDPWSVDERFPDLDLGAAIGTGEAVPGRLGNELRALLGSGRYLRVFGTVELDQLVELARALVPIEGGSGIGFRD